MSDRERIAVLLDLRTLKANGFTATEFAAAESLLEIAYIAFGKQAMLHEKEKDEREAAERAEAKGKEATPAKKAPKRSDLTSGFEYDAGAFDLSEDESTNSPVVTLDQEAALKSEFKSAFRAWKKLKVDWRYYFPDYAGFPEIDKDHPQRLDLVNHLMDLPMGTLYKKLIKSDPMRLSYGWLPRMATCSRGQLGTLLAESFCERILSQAADRDRRPDGLLLARP